MANDTERPTGATLGDEHILDSDPPLSGSDDLVVESPVEVVDESDDVVAAETEDGPTEHDIRLTRTTHVALGLVIAAAGAWMLYRSETELPYRGIQR